MKPLGGKVHAFTTEFKGLTNQLVTPVNLSLPTHETDNNPSLFSTNALWDTGATNSVITSDTVKKLGLKPDSIHLINIYLPSMVAIPFVQVTECSDISGNFGAIIGMDIITLGDFVVTNFDKKSTLTFRIPSVEKINFVKNIQQSAHVEEKVGRNEPCPCRSGKKYKNCHGKNV